MKKFLISLILGIFMGVSANATEIPQGVKDFVNKDFPETNFRFDGVIVLPDNTMYLPVIPSKLENVDEISIVNVYPKGAKLKNKPEMLILNNRYVLLKVININGKKTVIDIKDLPDELQSGLLPQDIMLPKGLVIPKSLEGIIGDLDLSVTTDVGLRVNNVKSVGSKTIKPVPELDKKSFYIASGVNKNIQVISSNSQVAEYALEQSNVIDDLKGYDGKFLLVTYFDSNVMNIISLMDEKVIKSVHFDSKPEQILIDGENKIAYISSGANSSIYVFSLETMTLKKQLKINGKCEKLTLSADKTKLFYVDKMENSIWSVELNNNYKLRSLGVFPNISDIAYTNGKVYVLSRTRNRLAIVDYETDELIKELEVCEKPLKLYIKDKDLYILGAAENMVEVLETEEDILTDILYLDTNAFATNITPIDNTDLIMVTNARSGLYSVIDTKEKEVVKTSPINSPVRSIFVTDTVKTIK